MTIHITEDRRPIGHSTWVAVFRDGSVLFEFAPANEAGEFPPQVSFDRVAERDDVAEVHLVPFMQGDVRSYVKIAVQPGERVEKKWIRTFTMQSDDPSVKGEHPVIDAFALISDKPIRHFMFANGAMLITTEDEPPQE